MRIAVVGANGFVGSEIANAVEKSNLHTLIRVIRGDDSDLLLKSADVVIHAANPAGRFAANNDNEKDFLETVEKTARLLKSSLGKKFILISSISCRTQIDVSYGRHRRACELMALTQNATVVRLGPMFGGRRVADTLHDILAGNRVYVASETRYAYTDVSWSAKKILGCIDKPSMILELLASNSISLAEISNFFRSETEYLGPDDTQVSQEENDGPDARLVLEFGQNELDRMRRAPKNNAL